MKVVLQHCLEDIVVVMVYSMVLETLDPGGQLQSLILLLMATTIDK